MHVSALLDELVAAGGIVSEYHGRRLVRHFGDPESEYAAATEDVALFDRSHRARLRVRGRAPGQMLSGILTGRPPAPPTDSESVSTGAGSYNAVLTPKGKMISDLVALQIGDEDEMGFLLDVPVAGVAALSEHLAKFVPPRFAEVRDVSEEVASISLVGERGASVLSKLALGLRVEAETLLQAPEHRWWSTDPASGLVVVRTEEVWPPAWTVYGPVGAVRSLWQRAVEDGALPAGLGVWSTLRVEAGRPVFGTDMDEATLPPEAGIVDRAIDHTKGCYTGQEVIVRIRDRGHVNRHLQLLRLGDAPAPATGTELISTDGKEKVVGEVRSTVQSPRYGGTLALAYVRRGVDEFDLDGERLQLGEVMVEPTVTPATNRP